MIRGKQIMISRDHPKRRLRVMFAPVAKHRIHPPNLIQQRQLVPTTQGRKIARHDDDIRIRRIKSFKISMRIGDRKDLRGLRLLTTLQQATPLVRDEIAKAWIVQGHSLFGDDQSSPNSRINIMIPKELTVRNR